MTDPIEVVLTVIAGGAGAFFASVAVLQLCCAIRAAFVWIKERW